VAFSLRGPRRSYGYAFGPFRSEGHKSWALPVPSQRGIMNKAG